jgi:hypothetical protein
MSAARWVVVALGVAGWLVSYAYFGRYLLANGWDMLGGWAAAFTANDWAMGLLMDLVLVTAMMIGLAVEGRKRIGSAWAVAVVASLSLSVSASLAVYLVALWRAAPEEATRQ